MVAENKVYIISDKRNSTITYNWFSKINRDTENNNAIAKCTPSYLSKIQTVLPHATSGEKLLRELARLLNVAVDEDDFKYSNPVNVQTPVQPPQIQYAPQPVETPDTRQIEPIQPVQAVAVADTSKPIDYKQMLKSWLDSNAERGVHIDSQMVEEKIKQLAEPHKEALYKVFLPTQHKVLYPVQPTSKPTEFNFL